MKNTKKLICLALALAMVLALAACGGNGGSDSQPTGAPAADPTPAPEADAPEAPDEAAGDEPVDYSAMSIDELKEVLTTVNPGVLTVATSPDFAPYEFYALDEDGNPTLAGFDMLMAQYIADYLGLELEVLPMDFDGTLAELTNKNVDLGMAGYSPKPERAEIMDFTDVYFHSGQSFVCLQSNKDLYTDLASTNNPEFTIGAQTGSIQVDLAKANSPDADIVELSKVTDIIAQLISGKLDGAYIEKVVAEIYAVNYPELCVLLDVPYDVEGTVVGVCKDNPALLAAVNLALAECLSTGTFDSYYDQAVQLAAGDTYEGVLSEDGAVPQE